MFAVVAQRFAELISGERGLGTFGLPQRGNGAEVAEIEEIFRTECLRNARNERKTDLKEEGRMVMVDLV